MEETYKLGAWNIGLELSEDYDRLYDIIEQGYRVPAWILYRENFNPAIYDIVEVKMAPGSKNYTIGHRGVGYGTWDGSKADFILECKIVSLKYQPPISTLQPHELRLLANAIEERQCKQLEELPEECLNKNIKPLTNDLPCMSVNMCKQCKISDSESKALKLNPHLQV